MKNSADSEFHLSLAKAIPMFLLVLAVMETTATFAASRGGDWTVLLATQPTCFATALVVGLWLGLMTSSANDSEERLVTVAASPVRTTSSLDASYVGAA